MRRLLRSIRRASALRAAGALALVGLAASACIDTSAYAGDAYIYGVTGEIVDDGAGPRLEVDADTEFYTSGDQVAFYLESARLTVRSAGTSTVIPDPTLDLAQFPVEGEGYRLISLSAPSPIDVPKVLPQFCGSNAVSVDVTLRFYIRENDRDLERAPPIYETTGTGALTTTGTPPPSGVFETTAIEQSLISLEGQAFVASTSEGAVTYFAVADTAFGGFSLYAADASGTRELGNGAAAAGTALPVLSAAPGGNLAVVTGGRVEGTLTDEVVVQRYGPTGSLDYFTFSSPAASDSATFRASAAMLTDGTDPGAPQPTVVVALESSSPLDVGLGAPLEPQPDKYFGAFLVGVDAATGAVVSAAQAPGDVLDLVDLGAGESLVAWGDLPPSDPPRLLHVERIDATGAAVWSASYPMLTYAVDLTPTPDGGALAVAVDETGLDQRVVVLRFDDQGELVFSRSFAGGGAAGAALADSTLVSFTGASDLGAPTSVVSSAAAPTLVELDATGAPVRSIALACGGAAHVRAVDGGAALVLTFTELASIGDDVLQAIAGPLVVAQLDVGP